MKNRFINLIMLLFLLPCLVGWTFLGGWENDATTGSTVAGTDTYVCFYDGAAASCSDAGMVYTKATDILTVKGGVIFGDGTNKNLTLMTVNIADTNAKVEWDQTNKEFDFNYPINVGGTSNTLTFSNGATIINTDASNLDITEANVNITGTFNVSTLTASEIVITDASKNLASAAVATYPSLTELSYAKGLTSAIQTQLDSKSSADATKFVCSSTTTMTGCDYTCDGTDDDVQINAAVDAIEVIGEGKLLLSDGRFVTTASIVMVQGGIWIQGLGQNITFVESAAASSHDLFQYNNSAATEYALFISDFTGYGYNTTGSFFNNHIGANEIWDTHLTDLYLDGFNTTDPVVDLLPAWGVRLNRVIVEQNFAGGSAVQINGGVGDSGAIITDCKLKQNIGEAIKLVDARLCIITGNELGSGYDTTSGDNSKYSIYLDGSSKNVITGNTFSSSSNGKGSGVYVDADSDVNVINDNILLGGSVGLYGITLISGATGNDISNNYFELFATSPINDGGTITRRWNNVSGDGIADVNLSRFPYPIRIALDTKIEFGDAAVNVQSDDDGHLDVAADVSIDLDSPSILFQNATKPKSSISLMAGGAILPTSSYAQFTDFDGTNFSYRVLAFDTSADEKAYWSFPIPDNFTGTTVTFTYYWTTDSGGAGETVEWEVDTGGFANDEAWKTGALGGTAVGTSDTWIADGDLHAVTSAAVTCDWTAGDMATVYLFRDVSGDDLGGDAYLIGVKIEYSISGVSQ